ncbi:ATP-binding protein [Methylocystis sp. JR02]|uniref:ATP-binding protein n=1 Tax=Methylocystis sp. JR02 TaxID=3046284 RepID=UPI0024B9540E|nr:ATP-binding protein [Methylocystis sp. JR02]MDJ0448828.1 ATP-binding protein [Methylocystis sp. JR02]
MSNVNIKRLVENIRSGTNVYTPVVELIVNSIQAIDETKSCRGLVDIQIKRDGPEDLIERLRSVDGFIVSDNGVGFNQRNRDSFDELYSEQKKPDGGKGFGRFTCLKYFDRMHVRSIFVEGGTRQERTFRMGLDKDIIVDESVRAVTEGETGSVVEIAGVKSVKFPDKGIDTISRVIVERLLPYFVDDERPCPRVVIRDEGSVAPPIALNDYLAKENSQIVEMAVSDGSFALSANGEEKTFQVRVFKFYSPRVSRSKISLVAHRREVTDVALQSHIPEFADEFFEPVPGDDSGRGRNFVIKAYVFGDYLNDNVSLERGEFRFQTESDLLNGISQSQIEQRAAEIAQQTVGDEISERKQRKQARIDDYVSTQAPWHRSLSSEVDFSALPMRPSNQDIELHLQQKKFEKEVATRAQVAAILESKNETDLDSRIAQVMESISETSKNDLIHYVSMRKCVLDIFGKALEADEDGRHRSEGEVHDIIMQRRKDSDEIDFDAHNLWILDERLNFCTYISSEKAINKPNGDRTDITIFNNRVAFRGENVASNPITIFEFKRPQRTDFANPSSDDDPVAQIIRYVNQIRTGKFKTPKNRDILVNENTPFYGYIVCDTPKKVADWLELEKDFKSMPDGLGWFYWHSKLNLYIEVVSWTKILRDAEMRNRIFFSKLGIE